MGFQLVISEGKEAGREFEFDQDSVLIGRTAECDVILYEAGVSRKHARITVEGASFFIEDLGSSNGTAINGEKLAGKHTLKDGDSISLGPVAFSFKPKDLDPVDPTTDTNAGEGAHTRIVSVSEMQKSRNKGVAMLPKGASRAEVEEMGARRTQMVPALKGPRPSAPGRKPSTSGNRPAAKLAKSEADLPEGVEVAGGGRPRLVRVSGERPALSAADRARFRRAGPVGQAQLFWETASKPVRAVVSIVGVLLVVGMGAGVFALASGDDVKPRPKEPEVIGTERMEHSFGHGDVVYERLDSKTFDFEVKSPVQVMAVLHYSAKDINSKDEVSITVNGVEVG